MKGKTYVWVRARTDANGVITPEAFKIEEQLVRVGAHDIYLFLDEDRRWFLEEERDVREIPYHD